jgi:hypothetical protein
VISLAGLGFLIGTWSCSFTGGGQSASYTATYAYDLGKNWIAQRDVWTGGGGDAGYLTFDNKGAGWTYAVFESDRTATIFRAADDQPSHIVWRSVYPKAGMTDVFDKVSAAKYTLHFSGTIGGKSMSSVDVCTKR